MPSKQNITRNNHYVPQFYLKYWSNNGNTVRSYNGIIKHKSRKGWHSTPIKSTACYQDYYTDEIDGIDDDKIEHFFEKMENKAKPIFDRVKRNNHLNESEMHILVDYLIIQISRTPAFYEFSNDITASNFDPLFRKTIARLSTRDDFTKPSKPTHTTGKDFLPLNLEVDKEAKTITAETCIGRHIFLSSALSFTDGKIANLLRQSNWKIITSEESLFTSDNPVVFLRFDRVEGDWKTGLKAYSSYDLIAVYLPITPKHLLITFLGATEERIKSIVGTDDFFELIQRCTVNNARRYIYSTCDDSRVLLWRPQTVCSETYEALEKERKSWHSSNLKLEKDFFSHKPK